MPRISPVWIWIFDRSIKQGSAIKCFTAIKSKAKIQKEVQVSTKKALKKHKDTERGAKQYKKLLKKT